MLTEIEVTSQDIIVAINVLKEEINSRIQHGYDDIESLQRIADALEEADRVVIK